MPLSGDIIGSAAKWLGTPYSWGGGTTSGPSSGFAQGAGIKGFDCSSLVQYAYAQAGIQLPRTTFEQVKYGSAVDRANLQSGDLIFFSHGSANDHVAIYVGDGQMLEAPRTGLNVRYAPVDWANFSTARRIGGVVQGGGGQATLAGYTQSSWARELLSRLGVPQSDANVRAIVAWETQEGGHWKNNASYNPLNTTMSATGSVGVNSVGVKKYTSWESGLDATVRTLNNGLYGGVLASLKAGTDANAVLSAVSSSKWGTGKINVNPATVAIDNNPAPTSVTGFGATDLESALANSGFPAAFVNSVPELKTLFQTGVAQSWSADKFMGEIRKTRWWQTRSDAQRSYDELKTADPATWQAQLDQTKASVMSMANQLGVQMAPDRMNALVETVMRNKLDTTEVQQLVASEFHFNPGTPWSGVVGKTVNDYKKAMGEYYTNMTDDQLGAWVSNALNGSQDENAFQGFLKSQAAARFPHLKQQIDAGMSVAQIADPYKQAYAKMLEISPDSINQNDPLMLKALSYTDPNGKPGQGPQLMEQWKYMDYLRNDPRWLATDNAKADTMQMGYSVLKQLGLAV